MKKHKTGYSRPRRGTVMLYTVFAVTAILALMSLSVDLSHVHLAKAEITLAAETAARYAVTGIVNGTAVTKAQTAATGCTVDGSAVSLQSSDVELGTWNASTKTFTVTSTAPNAVRVTAWRAASRGNAIPLTFGRIVGQTGCTVHASAIAYYNKNIMLVVNIVTPLAATDVLTRDRLTAMGYNVVVESDATITSSAAADMRLVVVSETCTSGNVNTKLRDIAVPVLMYEPFLCDDMAMTNALQDTDFGLTTVGNKITVTAPGHALAAGFTGTVTITTLADTVSGGALAWGVPGGGGLKIATINGESTHGAIYAFDTGSLLVNGSPAPARRVGWFGSGPLGAFTAGAPASCWNSNGWAFFDAAVTWCLGSNPTIKTVK